MKILTLTTTEQKAKYVYLVFDMIVKSYEKCEGFHYKSNKQLLDKPNTYWRLVFIEDVLQCVVVYENHLYGDKAILVGSDDTVQGKISMMDFIKSELSDSSRYVWAEVSGSIEKLFKDKFGLEPVPAEKAKEAMPDKCIVSSIDGFHYYREIGGINRKKIIFGNLKNL